MERWRNRVAVITGASSGIGAAITKYLANNGMIAVGLARRKERIEALRNEVNEDASQRIHAIKCDVQNEDEIKSAFEEITSNYGPVAVLVNNAGTGRPSTLLDEDNTEAIRNVIDTNVMSVVYCTREAFRSMKTNEAGDGHVFLINSYFGHRVPIFPDTKVNIYPPSKFAVTAMTEVYRQEFFNAKTNIKITSISPGLVNTELIAGEIRELFNGMPQLNPSDIADALIYCLGTPPHVQIHELIIKPLGEMM